ncbi:hypothetical protein HK102_010238, partial [Quaeritorhiza haematococci]
LDLTLATNKRGNISLTHLLNFNFPPRQRHGSSSGSGGSHSGGGRKRGTYYEPFNKERFVNANYRFVMRDDGDYSVNLVEPDIMVNWSDVVQVVMPVTKSPTCPICLHPPTAAKITKCGHVFCYPCVLHYLSLADTKWRKCPICYDSVYAKDLKSVRVLVVNEVSYRAASVKKPVLMKMALMKRGLNSTVALPRSGYTTWTSQTAPPPYTNPHAFPSFSKLVLSSPQYLRDEILGREQRELDRVLQEALAEEEIIRAMLMGGSERGGRRHSGGPQAVQAAPATPSTALASKSVWGSGASGRRSNPTSKTPAANSPATTAPTSYAAVSAPEPTPSLRIPVSSSSLSSGTTSASSSPGVATATTPVGLASRQNVVPGMSGMSAAEYETLAASVGNGMASEKPFIEMALRAVK